MVSKFVFLLLFPVLFSVTPPIRIPDLHAYESRSGDYISISPDWKSDDGQLDFSMSDAECLQSVSGRAYRGKKNRFYYNGDGGTLYFNVSKRRIKVSGGVTGCGTFEGTYRRVHKKKN
jgi:hypothetical protein